MNTSRAPRGRVALLDRRTLTRECLARAIQCGGDIEVVGEYSELEVLLQDLPSAAPDLALLELSRVTDDWAAAVIRVRARHGCAVALLDEGIGDELRARCLSAGAADILDQRTLPFEELMVRLRRLLGFDDAVHTGVLEAAPDRRLSALSPREREVLAYLAGGADNLKIAAHLGVCERTVKGHVSSLYRKLDQENRTQLALFARELGLRPPKGL